MKILLPPALDMIGLPTPQAVTEAMALATVAETLAAEARTAGPSIETATAATAADVLGAVVEHELPAPLILRHASHLSEIATARIAQAWEAAATELAPQLKEAFNKAAKTFTAEASRLPSLDPDTIGYQRSNPLYKALFESADVLSTLASVRDGLAGRTYARADGLHSDYFERESRVLSFENVNDSLNHPLRGQRRDVGWWLAMAQHPRITIQWNDRTDQLDMLAAIQSGRPTT